MVTWIWLKYETFCFPSRWSVISQFLSWCPNVDFLSFYDGALLRVTVWCISFSRNQYCWCLCHSFRVYLCIYILIRNAYMSRLRHAVTLMHVYFAAGCKFTCFPYFVSVWHSLMSCWVDILLHPLYVLRFRFNIYYLYNCWWFCAKWKISAYSVDCSHTITNTNLRLQWHCKHLHVFTVMYRICHIHSSTTHLHERMQVTSLRMSLLGVQTCRAYGHHTGRDVLSIIAMSKNSRY